MAPNPDLACGILTNIGELWLEEEFCDLTINIDDYQFRCHKFHLSANSAFFKTLLRSQKTDGSTNSISHVTIRGIDPEIFGLVLKVVYKGEICVDENNMIQIWHAAHELQIDVLVSKCEDFVMAHMTLDNYENIYYSSILLESARVKDFIVTFIAKHFDKFRQTSLFLDLPSNFLMDIVNSEALVVGARDGLVDSIVMWAKHKFEQIDESDEITVVVKADDLENQAKGDKQCVEIMFSQPPAALEDESSRRKLRQILQETERREETLGKLLNLAKLEQTSPDYLTSLVDNDWLMSIKEARNAVWKAYTTLLTSKPSTVDRVIQPHAGFPSHENPCKDAVVYKLKNSYNILVHRGTTGKRYGLLTDIDVLNSPLLGAIYNTTPEYVQSNRSDQSHVMFKINGRKCEPAELNCVQKSSFPVVVGNYLYTVATDGSKTRICRMKLTSEESELKSWHFVGEIPVPKDLEWIVVHEETIILCYSERKKYFYGRVREYHNTLQLYSFFTSTLSAKYLGEITPLVFEDVVATVFINNKLYILQGNGQFWKVSLNTASGEGVTRFSSLWSGFSMQLYNVIKVENDLIIFADLQPDKLLSTRCKDLKLNLKFV